MKRWDEGERGGKGEGRDTTRERKDIGGEWGKGMGEKWEEKERKVTRNQVVERR